MPLVPPQQVVAWLSLLDGTFSLVIFRDQHPAFIRTKIQARSTATAVLHDLQHSLVYCHERLGIGEIRRLILVAAGADPELDHLLAVDLGLEVIRPEWDALPPRGRLPSDDPSHVGMLAAAAGIFGT
jgi:hypothetical protein